MLRLVCNSDSIWKRIAIIDGGSLSEISVEKKEEKSIAGNIYKGKVTKILPGIQVAFVDIGLEKSGFLYVGSLLQNRISDSIASSEGNGFDETISEITHERPYATHIEDILTEGEYIMVQVSRNPIMQKGAKLSSFVSFPGRYIVMLNSAGGVSVSRRISSDSERTRLKEMVEKIRSDDDGYIIRTAAEGCTEEDLKEDMVYLKNIGKVVYDRYCNSATPSLIYEELGLVERSIRDLLINREDVEIVLDSKEEYNNVKEFCKYYFPYFESKVILYEGEEEIFDVYNIEVEFERLLDSKIWLKSGGYIVIDHTEALTAIDVNTGRFTGKFDREETLLMTNIEAVKEIVYQLKLRNIGGIVIIDFIDMLEEENRDHIYNLLTQELKDDRHRSNILRMSELGLVEMTRKRIRDSVASSISTDCPYCLGRGRIKSSDMIVSEIFRQIRKLARAATSASKVIDCIVADKIAYIMMDENADKLVEHENSYGISISVQRDYTFHEEQYQVKVRK